MQDIRERLRKIRKYKEISAKDLAKLARVSVNTIQAMENLRMMPNLEFVIKICNVLEVDLIIKANIEE